MRIKIDLHTHPTEGDGYKAFIAKAKAIGLNAIAFTDHEVYSDYDLVEPNFLILNGAEITDHGYHILDIEHTLRILAHPWRMPFPELEYDAVERYSYHVDINQTYFELDSPIQFKKRIFLSNSDAHHSTHMGSHHSVLEVKEFSKSGIINAIMNNKIVELFKQW